MWARHSRCRRAGWASVVRGGGTDAQPLAGWSRRGGVGVRVGAGGAVCAWWCAPLQSGLEPVRASRGRGTRRASLQPFDGHRLGCWHATLWWGSGAGGDAGATPLPGRVHTIDCGAARSDADRRGSTRIDAATSRPRPLPTRDAARNRRVDGHGRRVGGGTGATTSTSTRLRVQRDGGRGPGGGTDGRRCEMMRVHFPKRGRVRSVDRLRDQRPAVTRRGGGGDGQ